MNQTEVKKKKSFLCFEIKAEMLRKSENTIQELSQNNGNRVLWCIRATKRNKIKKKIHFV